MVDGDGGVGSIMRKYYVTSPLDRNGPDISLPQSQLTKQNVSALCDWERERTLSQPVKRPRSSLNGIPGH